MGLEVFSNHADSLILSSYLPVENKHNVRSVSMPVNGNPYPKGVVSQTGMKRKESHFNLHRLRMQLLWKLPLTLFYSVSDQSST